MMRLRLNLAPRISSGDLLQENVDELKIRLEIAGTHEGKRGGVLLQREPKWPSLVALGELEKPATEGLGRLIR
jgi:hypothetical protein